MGLLPGHVERGKPRVLIVDDDEDMRALLALHVRSLGHDAIEARSGAEALGLCESQTPPPIVLCDWGLPGLDGLELCRRVRAARGRSYVYVVIVTVRSQRTDMLAALQAGADEFLTKPVDREELSARLATAERILALEATLAARLRALEESHVRLVEAERLAAVGAVGITVRHEVNNPLAAIVGLAEVCALDSPGLPAGVLASLDKIKALALEIGAKVRRIEKIDAVRTKEYLPTVPGTVMLDLDASAQADRRAEPA
jgi:DNA-binding response OmpR family regulator